jgi:hypothetical protein
MVESKGYSNSQMRNSSVEVGMVNGEGEDEEK